MEQLRQQILDYEPKNQREVADKALILRCMGAFADTLTRENTICHLTASSWIVNNEHTKALLVYHNIMQMWAWTGGHADGESDLLKVAVREAKEETGLQKVTPLSEEIFSLEVLNTPPHVRRSEFVSAHIHLNCGFLLEADEKELLKVKLDENSGVRWFDFDDIMAMIEKREVAPHYAGLIERLENYQK